MKSIRCISDDKLRDVSLYRIFGVERLFQILIENKLTLLDPSKWEDPYEKIFQELGVLKEKHRFFGQCWSLSSRSDALWRIYSPNRLGVRVSTTIGRLIDSIKKDDNVDFDKLFLGEVTYLPEISFRKKFKFKESPLCLNENSFKRTVVTIKDAIQDLIDTNNDNAEEIAKALFIKRKAFDHEREVRLLYVDNSKNKSIGNNEFMKLEIDSEKLIRTIEFDPRMKDDVYESLKEVVCKVAPNFKQQNIKKSNLYMIPTNMIDKG